MQINIDWARWLKHFAGEERFDVGLVVTDTDGKVWRVDFQSLKAHPVPFMFQREVGQLIYMTMTTPGVLARVINGLQPLDEISIGYHARFTRTPDTYDKRFWDRFGRGDKTTAPQT